MGYEVIDPTLDEWIKQNGLYLYREYKETETRSVEFANEGGRQSQIWIDPPDEKGMLGIHVWDFKKRRTDFLVSILDLKEYLEIALKIARRWCS